MRVRFALLPLLLVVAAPPAAAQPAPSGDPTAGAEISVPAPVSGRRLSRPETITPADTLARVTLIHDNLELVRRYMGRPAPRPPVLRVEGAQPREVFFQSYNLLRRARQLAYEQLRTPVPSGNLNMKAQSPADVLVQLDKSLLVVLKVKRRLGIDEVVAERPRPDSTTASEVFNALVEAGQILDTVLDSETTASDTFRALTYAVNVAAAIHSHRTKRFLPTTPAFAPNTTSADTYRALHGCFEKVRRIAGAAGIEILDFDLDPARVEGVTPDQVVELIAVLLAELNYLHVRFVGRPAEILPYYTGRRYPSHALQRARYLDAMLAQMLPPEPR